MLSILIPTYNYSVFPLVEKLYKQCVASTIPFEIIVFDDASQHHFDNQKINDFENARFEVLDKNIGRSAIRNLLAKTAKYDWLLFLDADVLPENDLFIEKYFKAIQENKYQIVIGGYKYEDKKPDDNQIFRWKYGRNREYALAEIRNTNPYHYVFSGNILIQKPIFLESNYRGQENLYGMDVYFSYKIHESKYIIHHIDNFIYHLGLENSQQFFDKSLKAVESRLHLYKEFPEVLEVSPLLQHYLRLKKLGLTSLCKFGFRIFRPLMKKQILSSNPNLFLFDVYRLGYLCSL